MTKAVVVKQALKGLLDGMPIVADKNIQVTYGFPGKDPQRKWAVVGEVSWQDVHWVTNRTREETFTVAVIFCVLINGGTSVETEELALAMAAEFETKLKAEPSLGGMCVTTGFNAKTLRSWPSDTTAYEAQYECEVQATCRL